MKATLLAILLTGCGSTATSALATPDAAAEASVDAAPAPHYGYFQGDTMHDFEVRGFLADPAHRDVTMLPIVDTSLSRLRDAAPDCRCLLVATAANWCTPSKVQEKALGRFLDRPNRCIVALLAQDGPKELPTDDVLRSLGTATKPSFPLVMSLDSSFAMVKAIGAMPINFVLRTDTMQIVSVVSDTTPDSLFEPCESTF